MVDDDISDDTDLIRKPPRKKHRTGVDPGLILGCCKILQKRIEHRNDVICKKIIDSARSKKVQFCLQ